MKKRSSAWRARSRLRLRTAAASAAALVLIGFPAWGAAQGEDGGATAADSMYGGTASLYFWGQDVPTADLGLNQWVTRMYISPVLERLVEADFVQYGPRGSGEYTGFTSDNVPEQYSRGALAESWEVTADRMVFNIRPGVTWAADGKEHVMESRPYTAADCAYALNRIADYGSGWWRTENGGFIDSIHAPDDTTCVVETSSFNPSGFANVAQHAGSGHYPEEVIEAGAGSWDNLVGTGPFLLKEAVVGSHIAFERNPNYWRTTMIDGAEYPLPFIDELVMPNLPDESTQIASLRTGKLDVMGTVSVKYRETLADTSPELESSGWVEIWPVVVALNMENEYLANRQVRRALMMAVDQEAIIDAVWGYGALYNFPVDWRDGSSVLGDFDQLPESVRELYRYDPEMARQTLADAGYPDGFEIDIAFTPAATAGTHGEIATMMAGYFDAIGVDLELKSMERTALSALRSSRAGYDLFATNSSSNDPYGMFGGLASADESNPWNTPNYDNPEFGALRQQAGAAVDPAERAAILKEMSLMLMDDVAYIPIGASGRFVYWWPWVKNYYGEAMSGGTSVGPYMAHLWIDRALKAEMGY